MKKRGILQHELSDLIARMGHTDTLVIADAGLPVPPGVQRIDLAVTGGVPSFMQVLQPLLEDLAVESVIIAKEQSEVSPAFHKELKSLLGSIPIKEVPHVEFKQATQNARAVIRTGEFTYYANIIIVAGVAF
ncbi:MAG: D-ribose pyranase [Chloroflexota bacterium]